MEKKQTIIFVESNTTGTGIEIMKLAKKKSLQPILLTRNPLLYKNLPESIEIFQIETNNFFEISYQIETISKNYDILGIMTTSEYYIPVVAKLCELCNFPSLDTAFVEICRDKTKTRTILTNIGLPQPNFRIITEKTDLNKDCLGWKFPVVIKPYNESGSVGVKECHSIDESVDHVKKILNTKKNSRGFLLEQKLLVEEMIYGDEYSVEVFYQDGPKIIGITKKFVTGFPYFVEKAHIFPAEITDGDYCLIESTVLKALKNLEYTFGPLHIEVKIYNNQCFIIEINPRLAGGMIPKLIELSTGINLIEAFMNASIKYPYNLSPTKQRYSQISFLTSTKKGKLVSIKGLNNEEFAIHLYKSIGSLLQPPESSSDRIGYIITTKNSYLESLDDIKTIEELTKITVN
ncbi:hypothetical protein A5881_003625 [Enterococcus termitis]